MGHKWLLGHVVESHATGDVVEHLLRYPHSAEIVVGNHRRAMERLLDSTSLYAEHAIDDYVIRGEVKLVGANHTESLRMRGQQQSAANSEEIFMPRRIENPGVPVGVKVKHVNGKGSAAYSFAVKDVGLDPADFRMDSDGNLFYQGAPLEEEM